VAFWIDAGKKVAKAGARLAVCFVLLSRRYPETNDRNAASYERLDHHETRLDSWDSVWQHHYFQCLMNDGCGRNPQVLQSHEQVVLRFPLRDCRCREGSALEDRPVVGGFSPL
jgi:hypothetical protein